MAFVDSAMPQLLVDPKLNMIISANQEAYTFFGLDILSLCDTLVSNLFSLSYPQLLAFTDEVLDTKKAWSDEIYISRVSQYIRVKVTAKTVKIVGQELIHFCIQCAEVLSQSRDIVQAHLHNHSGLSRWGQVAKIVQQFERDNKLILDASNEGVFAVDVNGLITFVRPAAEHVLGYSAKELTGKNIHSFILRKNCDGNGDVIQNHPIYQTFRGGVIHNIDNDIFWGKSGKPVNVKYTSTPMKNDDKIVGAVVIFRAVTQKIKEQKKLLATLKKAKHQKHRLELENSYLQEELRSKFNNYQIVGKSLPIQKVIKQIEWAALTGATVLITGEPGTSKELIARAIHDLSQRNHCLFIRVNCAAIHAESFESEFFGHVKGALSGAVSDHTGYLELANESTIFLDKVSEIPLKLQGKLLRVLQQQQFSRVGESRIRQVNVRVIASTSCCLIKQVEAGNFREDLYFRLNVFPIKSVPLRERVDDIPLLTQHFLDRMSAANNTRKFKIPVYALDMLKEYHWPGNIQELENIIQRQMILSEDDTLHFADLNIEAQPPANTLVSFSSPDVVVIDGELKQNVKHNMLTVLQHSHDKDGASRATRRKTNHPCVTY